MGEDYLIDIWCCCSELILHLNTFNLSNPSDYLISLASLSDLFFTRPNCTEPTYVMRWYHCLIYKKNTVN